MKRNPYVCFDCGAVTPAPMWHANNGYCRSCLRAINNRNSIIGQSVEIEPQKPYASVSLPRYKPHFTAGK